MRLLMLVFLTLQCVCNAQGNIEDDWYETDSSSGTTVENDCHEADNCTQLTSCIRYYDDLQSYVLSNKEIMRNLKETFFVTGEDPSEFVRITYHFLLEMPNSTNNINSSTIEDEDNITSSCFSHESTYIWSESALYLLGPKSLFWYTLFAVNIPEINITIDLPCLCNGVNENLLNRFTYLVRIDG